MERVYLSPLYFFIVFHLFTMIVYCLDSEYIIGGTAAIKGQFPYHVSIEIFGSSVCGGAIIDETHVITAAHCVVDKSINGIYKYPFKVVGGTLDSEKKDPTKQGAYVEKIFVPQLYLKTLSKGKAIADIAVLTLKQPLNLKKNSYLGKLTLPKVNETYDGVTAIVTGYGYNWVKLEMNNDTGKLEEVDGGSSNKLRFAKTTVLSKPRCQINYSWNISDDQICAKVEQQSDSSPEGICSGDSGGPLVLNSNVLIGVVSSSPAGCRENIAAALYTRVGSFLEFIDKSVKNQTDSEILSKTIMTKSRYFDDD